MKIGVLATSYPRSVDDHASVFVHGLSRGIAQKGYNVQAIVPHESGLSMQENMEGVDLFRFRYFFPTRYQQVAYGFGIPENIRRKPWAKWQLPFFGGMFFLKALWKFRDRDVLHAHWEISALIAIWIGKVWKIPVIYTVHRLVTRSRGMAWLTRYLLRHVDEIHFNSTYTQDLARELMGVQIAKHQIIYPSIDFEFFMSDQPAEKLQEESRKQYDLPIEPLVILGLGRLVEKKGFFVLLEAFYKMQSLSQDPKVLQSVLVIAGGGPLLESLKQEAKKLRLGKQVRFTGFVKPFEVRDYLRCCDVFVVPSIQDQKGEVETLGVVSMEAMAVGKPVVASKIGGIPDVIDHEQTGILVEPGNPLELAKQLISLIKDDKKRQELSKSGQQKCQKSFTWPEAIEKTMASYQALES